MTDPMYPPVWQDHDTLRVDMDGLMRERLDRLPPETEMRVRSIMREAQHPAIYFAIGDGPYAMTEHDLHALADALDSSSLLWAARPPKLVPPEKRVEIEMKTVTVSDHEAESSAWEVVVSGDYGDVTYTVGTDHRLARAEATHLADILNIALGEGTAVLDLPPT